MFLFHALAFAIWCEVMDLCLIFSDDSIQIVENGLRDAVLLLCNRTLEQTNEFTTAQIKLKF